MENKKILITGKNGYVANCVEKYLKKQLHNVEVEKVSLRNENWKKINFDNIEVVLHTAGLVHKDEKKITQEEYDKVNCNLTVELATTAKKAGVKQFIFISTMSVYGVESGKINKSTLPMPKTKYGISKYKAELEIEKLASDFFTVTIIRPPMVYGKNCPGNYSKLSKMACTTPLFPKMENQRSMIYIDNLSAFILETIQKKKAGIFCPQNESYVSTSELVKEIAACHDKNLILVDGFENMISFAAKKSLLFNKVFGSLVYEDGEKCCKVNFKESIQLSEST